MFCHVEFDSWLRLIVCEELFMVRMELLLVLAIGRLAVMLCHAGPATWVLLIAWEELVYTKPGAKLVEAGRARVTLV